jgi:hypothetical protein
MSAEHQPPSEPNKNTLEILKEKLQSSDTEKPTRMVPILEDAVKLRAAKERGKKKPKGVLDQLHEKPTRTSNKHGR